jgi:hypothetical protein
LRIIYRRKLDIPLSLFPLYQLRPLGLDVFEQITRGLVTRVLRNEFPTDGEVEDGLAELLDVFGSSGETLEMIEVESSVLSEFVGISTIA